MSRIHDVSVAITALLAVALGGACGSSGGPLHEDAGPSDAASPDLTRPDDSSPDGDADEPAVPVFEPTLPATACTLTSVAAASPLLVDATFGCNTSAGQLSVAAGAGGDGFVALSNVEVVAAPSLLFTIPASGSVSASRGPNHASNVSVLADVAGRRFLVGDTVPGVGVAIYAPMDIGWMRERVGPSSAMPGLIGLASGRISTDGHAFVVYDDFNNETWHLRERDAAGTWTAPSGVGAASAVAVTLDAGQRPHVLTLTPSSSAAQPDLGVTEWQPGHAAVPWTVSLSSFAGGFAAATSADGTLALAITTKGGIHLVTSKAEKVADQLLADTQQLAVTGCPPLPLSGGAVTPPTMCTEQGGGASFAVGIAATDGGALWIAYLQENVDRDVTQQCVPFADAVQCSAMTAKDRSTGEVVLVKIAAGTSTIAWRAPLTGSAGARLALDARASRLHLAFAGNPAPQSSASWIRYVVLDATKL